MTYHDLSDQDIIRLLDGQSVDRILNTMSQDMLPGDIKDINDIFMEIMEMAQPETN